MALPDLSHLTQSTGLILVKASPKAAHNRITLHEDHLRIAVTAPADKGKANTAIQKLLAKAMGCAPSHLTLVRGHTTRIKQFRYDPSGP